MKIDLPILYTLTTKKQPDLGVGEFAKSAVSHKLYDDKLKQVLISKFHLNALLMSGLPQQTTFTPLNQIMGFSCHLYILRYVEGYYLLHAVSSVSFPVTHEDIKDNGIKELISCLETAKVNPQF